MVPVAPDISNMIPCKLTGKPFWDIYLYDDPPWWEAYIRAVKFFCFDGWLFHVPVVTKFDIESQENHPEWQEAIVFRTADRIYTRRHRTARGKQEWEATCTVYYIADPPTAGVPPEKVGLPPGNPEKWEDVVRRSTYKGTEAFHAAMKMMGDDGVVAFSVHLPGLRVWNPNSIYQYYDNREAVLQQARAEHETIVKRTEEFLALKPDLILIGISGHMLANPEPVFRELSLPTLKVVTSMAEAEQAAA